MVLGKLLLKGLDVLGEGEKEILFFERWCLLIIRLLVEVLCCSVGMFFFLNVFVLIIWMFR